MKQNYQLMYEAAKAENEKLKKELAMSDADWEIGKKSPRDLAIKWLCRAINVSAYNWQNGDLLMTAIDRLIALDNAQNAQNKGCAGNEES